MRSFMDWIHAFEDGEQFPSAEVKMAYENYKSWEKLEDLRHTEQGWANLVAMKNLLKKLLEIK